MTRHTKLHSRHPRLLLASIAGLVITFYLPAEMKLSTRVLTGWNVAVWSYLLIMGWIICKSSQLQISNIAKQEDKGAIVILAIVSITAILSLAAIGLELASVSSMSAEKRYGAYLLTAVTVLGSWLLVSIMFAFHYAHTFYLSDKTNRAMMFPEKKENPNYWDFLYLAFTISVAAQTSDISIMNTSARKTVTAQAILSFLFNAAIIGLLINITAGIIGSH